MYAFIVNKDFMIRVWQGGAELCLIPKDWVGYGGMKQARSVNGAYSVTASF